MNIKAELPIIVHLLDILTVVFVSNTQDILPQPLVGYIFIFIWPCQWWMADAYRLLWCPGICVYTNLISDDKLFIQAAL